VPVEVATVAAVLLVEAQAVLAQGRSLKQSTVAHNAAESMLLGLAGPLGQPGQRLVEMALRHVHARATILQAWTPVAMEQRVLVLHQTLALAMGISLSMVAGLPGGLGM